MSNQQALVKTILISQYPLPYHKIGSWTNMYKKYLENNHQIDHIICAEPQMRTPGIHYTIVKESIMLKIRRRFHKYYKLGYIDALEKILQANPSEKWIIQVVDNFDIVLKIIALLKKKGIRQNCYIQVFYHGFDPFIETSRHKHFYEKIDELILLTKDSYKAHKAFYTVFPCKITLLPNGIDTQVFQIPQPERKENLKTQHGFSGKKVFVWCSQDRPKKGLSLILEAWRNLHLKYPDTVLLIIGAKRDVTLPGVVFIGKLPNDQLPKYYQMSDCYLFPSLCHEGFGLSLIEALNCGCYCIASNAGGIPEVLHYGKLGKLIENPNFVSEWETAIDDYLSGAELPIYTDRPRYDITEWISNMNRIISEAKNNISA